MYVRINIERLFSVVHVGAAVYLLASLLAPDSESNRERLVWKVSLLQRITVVWRVMMVRVVILAQ